jgi:hypothetical protein
MFHIQAEALHTTTNNAGSLYYTYHNNVEEGSLVRRMPEEVEAYGTNIYEQLLLQINQQNNTAKVVSCSSEATAVVIPSQILGYIQVTEIADYAFQGCANLTSVTIPTTILEIGDYAFENCVSLKSVALPNSLDSLGTGVFYGCMSLQSITIAYSDMTMLPNRFAEGCTSLTSCNIPDNIRTIGAFAFHNSGMTSLEVGENVTSVGEWALYTYKLQELEFMGNTPPAFPANYGGLVTQVNFNIQVPSGKQMIYAQAFQAGYITCKGVEESKGNSFTTNSVTYRILSDSKCEVASFSDASATYLAIPGNVMDGSTGKYYDVTSIGYLAVKDATNVSLISLPATLTNIEEYAFAYSNTVSLVIPEKVTTIGKHAFFGCGQLEFLGFQGEVPPTIGEGAYVLGLASVHIPKGLVNTYQNAFGSNVVYKELVEDASYGTYTESETSNPAGDGVVTEPAKPAKPTLTVTKKSSGIRTLKVKKVKGGATNVIIYRSTKKTGTYKKLATKQLVSGKTTLKYNDKKAKKNKTYYYKVRTYYTYNGKKVLSSFSKVKKSK